jgi:pilus assembly protein Flp/PilA
LKNRRIKRQEFTVRRLISRFIADQSGATAIEYGLIAAFLSITIVATVNSLGSSLVGKYTAVDSALTTPPQ